MPVRLNEPADVQKKTFQTDAEDKLINIEVYFLLTAEETPSKVQ